MAYLKETTADTTQKTIHEQIRVLAEYLLKETGVKLEGVNISWYDSIGEDAKIYEITLKTSKR